MLLFRHVIKGFADMSCHASVLGLHFFMRSNVYVNSRSKFVTFNVPILKLSDHFKTIALVYNQKLSSFT